MAEQEVPAAGRYLVPEMAWVQDVTTQHVWRWMGAGWKDFLAAWQVSATYAASFIIVGLIVSFGFYFMELPYLILPALSGFLLVGPALGTGFYEVSRRLAAGEPVRLRDAYLGFRRNGYAIMGLGVALVFLFQVWIRLSFTVFAISFPGISPDWMEIIPRALSSDGLTFAISITVLGAVFAIPIFFSCAISMPLMVGRRTVLIPSMLTSVYAVWRNRVPMLLWSSLIVLFAAAGLITCFLGLVIVFPLLGHATWHAYLDVIEQEGVSAS